MCGICGIINFEHQSVLEENIQVMLDSIKHRGPDDKGIFIEKNIGLGNVRLSIIDLSNAGHMPMFSDDDRYVIIHNGEIYNYIELKNVLKEKYNFVSKTDTEVVLNAYREWGVECLSRLNGMFAFFIYDRKERRSFAARDRFGIKPFYYYHDHSRFIFASEIRPILLVMEDKEEPNNSTIFDYLVFNRTNQTENTFFKGIKKLQHSHYLTIQNSAISIEKWYNLKENLNKPFENSSEFRDLLTSSIDLRLRSDVPVGACLSGGLDSSSIVSIIYNNFKRQNLHTFSAVYEKGLYGDESPYIKEFDDHLNHMHFIKPSSDSLCTDINAFVLAQNEPVSGTSAYAEFKVMDLAKDYVTVILNGQGVDEELAGYHYFFGFFFKELFQDFQWGKLTNEIYHYIKNHRSYYGIAVWLYLLLPDELKAQLRLHSKSYYNRDFIRQNKDKSIISNTLYKSPSLHDSLVDHFEHKFEHHLIWGDRSSMWFSLELRFPFLDHRIVESLLSLSNQWIINNGMTKHILRETMKGLIPEKIRTRTDKIGFETPEDEWFRTKKMKELIFDLLHSKKFGERGYFNIAKIIKSYENHLARKSNISNDIWKWINLELWFKEFIDAEKPKITSTSEL